MSSLPSRTEEQLTACERQKLDDADLRLRSAVAACEPFIGRELQPTEPVPVHDLTSIAKAQAEVEVADQELWRLREELLGSVRPSWAPARPWSQTGSPQMTRFTTRSKPDPVDRSASWIVVRSFWLPSLVRPSRHEASPCVRGVGLLLRRGSRRHRGDGHEQRNAASRSWHGRHDDQRLADGRVRRPSVKFGPVGSSFSSVGS